MSNIKDVNFLEKEVVEIKNNVSTLQEDVSNGFSQDMVDAGIQKKIADGTIANLTIEDAIITGDKLNDNAGDGLVKENSARNLFNKSNIVNDNYLGESGAETSETNYSYGADYISVDMTKTYAFTGCYGKSQQGVLYDENKAYVGILYASQCTGTAGVSLVCDFSTLNKPTAKYIRLNTTTGKLNEFMFVQSSTYPTKYISYNAIAPKVFKSNDVKNAIVNIINVETPNIISTKVNQMVQNGDIDFTITADKLGDNAGDGLVDGLENSANLFNKANVKNNFYLAESGTETSGDNYCYGIDYIPIDVTKKYAFYGCYGKNQQIILYDENKNYVKTIYSSQCSGELKSYVIDFTTIADISSVKYARVNTTTNSLDKYMFVQADSYPSSYIPYGYTSGSLKSNKLQSVIESIVDSKSSSLEGIILGETVNVNGNDQLIAIGTNTPKDTSLPAVAIGYGALQNNITTGSDDTGRFNVAVGSSTLNTNTTGNHNTAVGYQAMRKNTTGNGNTGIGEDACIANTTGNGNTGVGRYSLFTNKTGSDNVAIGLNASYLLEGDKNTTVGVSAGRSNKTGEGNTYLGYYANGNDAITNATAIGNQAYVKESNTVQIGNSNVTQVCSWGDFTSQRNGGGIVLLSPNGTKYKLTVTNDGQLSITPVS